MKHTDAQESKGISAGGPYKIGASPKHNEIFWVEDKNGNNILGFKDGQGSVWTDKQTAMEIVEKWNTALDGFQAKRKQELSIIKCLLLS